MEVEKLQHGIWFRAPTWLRSIALAFTLIVVSAALGLAQTGRSLQIVLEPPASLQVGQAFTMHVQVEDANGDPDGAYSPQIALTLVVGTQDWLSGTKSKKVDADGVARFDGLSISQPGSYRISASGGPATPDTTATFVVESSGATALEFQQQPTTTQAGAAISPAVTVRAVDGSGTTDASFTGNVTIAIGTNPGGGSLSGTTTVAAVSGVATFSNLSINRTGTGYTLTAAASGMTGATSAAFDITPGPASGATTTIDANPTSVPADGASTSTITVRVFDALGNPRTAGGDVVTLSHSPTAGTMGPVTDQGDGTYTATLTAPSAPATTTVSGTVGGNAISDTATVTFTATNPLADHLEFQQQPTTTQAGAAISPAVTVRAVTPLGTTDILFNGEITVAIGTNPGGGSLSGTTTVAAVSGVATFSNLSINRTGTGYTLTAAASGLTGATSAAFNITPGPASGATTTIDANPTSVPADGASTSTITVRVFDALGNPRTAGGDVVTLSHSPTAGTMGSVTDQGNGTYTATLTAPSAPATTTVSGTVGGNAITDTATVQFTAVAPVATALAFGQQPTSTAAGTAITPAVTVRAVDGSGTTVTSFTGNITIAIGTNPAAGTLSGTTTVAAVAGVATFSNLSINRTGTGYTLTAAASGLTGATSAAFNITPGPASGATTTITAAPTSVPADGFSTSVILVEARDALGNRRTTGGDVVTLETTAGTRGTVTDRGDGTYTATLTAPSAPADATVTGTIGGNAITDTATVTFTAVSPTSSRLVFDQQPTNVAAGAAISPPVVVRAVDNAGNTVTSFAGSVSISIGINPAAGSLAGTTTVAAVAGVATFSGLSIDRAGSGYTLIAGATGLTGATSVAFAVTPGAASGATTTITAEPATVSANGTSTSTITVEVLDAFGNRRVSGGDAVALTTTVGTLSPVSDLGNGTYQASLRSTTAGTATVRGTVNGVSITDTASVVFSAVTPSTVLLVFGQQPTDAQGGALISPPITVRAVDGSGTTLGSFTGSITIAMGANPGGGTLSGTTSVAAVGGVAVFGDLSIQRAGSGYTLTASATGTTGATSAPFDIAPGPASGVTTTISATPASVPADGVSNSAITVEVRDAFGNRRTSGGDAVSLFTTAGTLGFVTDSGDGTYRATLTAPSTAATATITGTVNGQGITDTATVTFTGGGTDLAVTIDVDDRIPSMGGTVVYTIRASNQGSAPATGVEVLYELGTRQTFLTSEASQGSYDAVAGVWSIGTLEPGAEATLSVAAQVTR